MVVAPHLPQPVARCQAQLVSSFSSLPFLDGPETHAETGGPGTDFVFPLDPSVILLLALVSSLDRCKYDPKNSRQ